MRLMEIHRRFIARCYRRGCPAATPRGLQGESCSTAAGFVLRTVKRRQARCKRAQIEAFNSSTQQVATTVEEFSATHQTNAQVHATGSLGDKPLAVVSAGEQSPDWLEMQEELAALSPNSVHRVVDGATHESLLYDKGDSQVTSAAIERAVEAVRADRPLNR